MLVQMVSNNKKEMYCVLLIFSFIRKIIIRMRIFMNADEIKCKLNLLGVM